MSTNEELHCIPSQTFTIFGFSHFSGLKTVSMSDIEDLLQLFTAQLV